MKKNEKNSPCRHFSDTTPFFRHNAASPLQQILFLPKSVVRLMRLLTTATSFREPFARYLRDRKAAFRRLTPLWRAFHNTQKSSPKRDESALGFWRPC